MNRRLSFVLAILFFFAAHSFAAEPGLPERTVSARKLPVPTTVSPAMQQAIAAPRTGGDWSDPKSAEEWKARIRETNAATEKRLPSLREKFHVSVSAGTLGGVRVYTVKPDVIAQQNAGRRLLHLHGGGYIYFGGESATLEALLIAHHGQIEVLSVDYRMPPDDPFPAAVEDAVAAWKAVTKSHPAKNVGVCGTSAGGGLSLALVLKLKELGLPLPGAVMAGTPWSDLTKTGDTYFTNELVDNVIGSVDGRLLAAAHLYAGKHDLKEPLLSPAYGDFAGFPPTILLTGTRDLFLSNTVRVHQKLLKAGAKTELLVYEGQSHAQYLVAPDAPESGEAYRQVAKFFDRHLGK